MSGQGSQPFVDALSRFATEVTDPRVVAIAASLAAPLRVAVAGRRGVGRRTVADALNRLGITVTAAAGLADPVVYVIAEVAKPEDVTALAALAARRQPVLVVLNKSDLTDRAAAATAAAVLTAPVEPMSALLAIAALGGQLDGELWAALQVLATEPADLSCPEHFVTRPHPVPGGVRQQLCETLDLPGIGHAVAAVRQGRSTAQVRALLRRLSGIDTVARRMGALGAAVRYGRLLDAVAQLEALAVNDGRIGGFLRCDDAVVARMTAAGQVIRAAGLPVDGVDVRGPAGASMRLRQADRWQRYSRGPVAAMHRACGTDIARGLLRLRSMADEPVPEPG